MGQALKVPRVVAGSLSQAGSAFVLSAHFVDIQASKAENPVTENFRDGSPEVLKEGMALLARKLAATLPPPSLNPGNPAPDPSPVPATQSH